MALRKWAETNSSALHLIRLSGAVDHEVLFRAAESNGRKLGIVSATAGSYLKSLRFPVALSGAGSCSGNEFAPLHYRQLACLVVKLQIVHTFAYQRAIDLDVRRKIDGFFFA